MATKSLAIELKAKADKFVSVMDQAKKKTDGFGKSTKNADGENKKFSISLNKVAGAAGIAAGAILGATTALAAYADAQGRSMKESEAYAKIAGLTNEEFKRMAFVAGTAGFAAKDFGDIMKDVKEKVGDFLNTGGGGFQDYADALGLTKEQAKQTAKEFEHMSGQAVLQTMMDRMEAAGISSSKMSHALEGVASETTKLIPLLENGGAKTIALGKAFDEINISITEEEREQFKKVSDNMDLAQIAFINFINNAVSPFLPAINSATEAFAKFFSVGSSVLDLNDVMDGEISIDDIKSLQQIDNLLEAASTKSKAIKLGDSLGVVLPGIVNAGVEYFKLSNAELDKTIEKLKKKKELLEKEKAIQEVKVDPLKAVTGATDTSAAEKAEAEAIAKAARSKLENKGVALEAELAANEFAKLSRQEQIKAEYDEEKRLIDSLAAAEIGSIEQHAAMRAGIINKITEARIKLAEENRQKSQDEEDSFTSDETKAQEAFEEELKALEEFHLSKNGLNEEYERRRLEIIGEYAPETLDRSLLEEGHQDELDLLQNRLETGLDMIAVYHKKVAALGKKDVKLKEDNKKKENFWSESSVKSQMDDGMKLLGALGNNSKTAHKIKQGLAAANVTMTTAENVTQAFPDPLRTAAAVAVGIAQLSAIQSSSPNGGGGGGISSATPTPEPQQQEEFRPETSSLDFSDSTSGSSNTMKLQFETDSGDSIMDAIAEALNKSQRTGR